MCTIYADTSQVYRQSKRGTDGVYYVQKFKIVLLCGLTEMQAQLSWVENVSTEDGSNIAMPYYLLTCDY